jgi:hypothetical protein
MVLRGTLHIGAQGPGEAIDRYMAMQRSIAASAELDREGERRGTRSRYRLADLMAYRTDAITCPPDHLPGQRLAPLRWSAVARSPIPNRCSTRTGERYPARSGAPPTLDEGCMTGAARVRRAACHRGAATYPSRSRRVSAAFRSAREDPHAIV